MRYLAILKIAFWALGRNKMRSALTMLGIIIGVGAVIALVSIGQGAQALIREQMAAMGTNVMYVWPQDTRGTGGARGASNEQGTLSDEDVLAIRSEVPVIAAATPIVTSNGQLIYKNNNMRANIQGVGEEFPIVRDWNLTSGSFFTAEDVSSRQRVLVVGPAIVEELFKAPTRLARPFGCGTSPL